MDPIVLYLKDGQLPDDKKSAWQIRHRAARYTLQNEILLHKSFTLPYLRCLHPKEAHRVLDEIHQGACGNHPKGRSLAYKAMRQGYYWPTMKVDAIKFSKRCDKCQRYSPIPHVPSEQMTPMDGPWPFAQWGVDIIGPLPTGKGQNRFAIVAVDYFTKWVEVEPLATITEKQTTKFLWRNIIYRYRLPHTIISDNGRQFDNAAFFEFCKKWKIRNI